MREHRVATGLGLSVVGGVVLLFGLSYLIPWTPLNCWTDEIDVTGGRYRYQRYLFCIVVTQEVGDTAVSRRYRELFGPLPEPPIWRRVNCFSPGQPRRSPQFAYHSALGAAKVTDEALSRIPFSQDAQRAVIRAFLRCLQEDGDSFRAMTFAMKINDLSDAAVRGNRQCIELDDVRSTFKSLGLAPEGP